MKDNFDLKKFLFENKLTAGSRQLTEEVSEDVWKRLDAAIAEDDGEAMKAIALELLGKAGNWAKEKVKQGAEWSKQKLMKAHGITDDDLNEAFNPKSKLAEVIAQAWAEKDLEKAKQIIRDLIEPSRVKAKDDILRNMEPIQSKAKFDYYLANSLLKFEGLGLNETTETTKITESTMTEREQYIVSLVENALGLEGYGDDNVINKLEKRNQEPPVEQPTYSEGDEMVKENPLPEYNTIEELMKDIEEGTNKTALEYRMKRTKELYEALDEQLKSLEEGEHAKHIDKKHTKKMRSDSAQLRKYEAKLIKEYERKYEKKATKKAASKKEEVPMEEIAVNESKTNKMEKQFDLKKFLVENKLTSNSRSLNESEENYKDQIQSVVNGFVEELNSVEASMYDRETALAWCDDAIAEIYSLQETL
ncbi:MAG TPA: hypothetical protein PKC87_02700 [Candidatus Absconditabacterales bacterium]|nr:hypothetical protein [Candidatus Absconditabacterales bacterium]